MQLIDTWMNEYAGLWRREYRFTNNKGEQVDIWISNSFHDKNYKRDNMNLWVKAGYLPEFIEENLIVDTYVEADGICLTKYNPTIKPGGAGYVLDFDWMLPATEENINRILAEIERRANA